MGAPADAERHDPRGFERGLRACRLRAAAPVSDREPARAQKGRHALEEGGRREGRPCHRSGEPSSARVVRQVLEPCFPHLEARSRQAAGDRAKKARPLPPRLDEQETARREDDRERDTREAGTTPDVGDEGILGGLRKKRERRERVDHVALDEARRVRLADQVHARHPEPELVHESLELAERALVQGDSDSLGTSAESVSLTAG